MSCPPPSRYLRSWPWAVQPTGVDERLVSSRLRSLDGPAYTVMPAWLKIDLPSEFVGSVLGSRSTCRPNSWARFTIPSSLASQVAMASRPLNLRKQHSFGTARKSNKTPPNVQSGVQRLRESIVFQWFFKGNQSPEKRSLFRHVSVHPGQQTATSAMLSGQNCLAIGSSHSPTCHR